VRQETNKLVADLVNLDRVRSLLKMISLRRRLLAEQEMGLNAQIGKLPSSASFRVDDSIGIADIPAIHVDAAPSTPPPLTRDITSPHSHQGRSDYRSPSPSPLPRTLSPELTVLENSFRSSLQRSRRTSDVSMLSVDMGHGYWFVLIAAQIQIVY
jgi:hypothetical protein